MSSQPVTSSTHRRVIQLAAFTTLAILAPTQAAVYTYTNTVSNTPATPDAWSATTNWDATPVSASDTTLNFTGGDSVTPLADGTTIFTNNDLGAFMLNQMNFTQYGLRTGTAPEVTITGGLLDFVADGSTAPALTVNTDYDNGGAVPSRVRIFIENNVRLAEGTTINLGGGSQLGISSSTIELTGNSITIGSAKASGTTTSGSEVSAQVNGQVTGTFGVRYGIASGTGTSALIVNNSANNYDGDTMLTGELSRSTSGSSGSGRALTLGTSEVIPNGAGKGNVIISMGTRSGYTLNLNGNSETINGLSSAGQSMVSRTVTNSSSSTDSTLTVGDNDQDGYFIGSFTGSRLSVNKIGTGNQVVSGTSTYGGSTTVTNGTLTLNFNDYNSSTQTNSPTDHFTQNAPLVLNGGTLAILGRDAGLDVDKLVTGSNSRSFTVDDTTGIVAGQSVRVFLNSNDTEYAASFLRSVDRLNNLIYLDSPPGSPTNTSTVLRLEFEPVAAGVTSQTFEALQLAASSTLDFGTTGSVVLTFAAAPTQDIDGTILSIANWSGIVDVGGGTERLLFTGSPTDFSNVFSQSEVNFIGQQAGYQLIDLGGSYEVVPGAVPEPASLSVLALGGLGLLSRRLRRR